MLYLLVRGLVLQVAWWPAGYDLTQAWEVADFVMGRYERFWGVRRLAVSRGPVDSNGQNPLGSREPGFRSTAFREAA